METNDKVTRLTQAIDLRVRVTVDIERALEFIDDEGYTKSDLVTLVRNEIVSALEDQRYVLEVEMRGDDAGI